MFTGIVDHTAQISNIHDNTYTIKTEFRDFELGESIAINGICLTVVDFGVDSFSVEVSPETKRLTTIQSWRIGHAVNVERSLQLGARLGGHIVMGHIDGIATLAVKSLQGDCTELTFTHLPKTASQLVTTKGSIAIDGVSLTVNRVFNDGFGVMIIPHTLSRTQLGSLAPGDTVNIEFDYLARYVRKDTDVHEHA